MSGGAGTVTTLHPVARYACDSMATGALVIQLPPQHPDAAYVLHLTGFGYATGTRGWSLVCSGYADRSAGVWTGRCSGSRGPLHNARVRFGFDRAAGVCCVVVGDDHSLWMRPAVMLARVDTGAACEALAHGWRLRIEETSGIEFSAGEGACA